MIHEEVQAAPTRTLYSLNDVRNENFSGSHFKINDYWSSDKSFGLSQVKFYIADTARVGCNYMTFITNTSKLILPTNVYNFNTTLATIQTNVRRFADHIMKAGCHPRIEFEYQFTYKNNDVNSELKSTVTSESLYTFTKMIITENNYG